MIEPEFIKRCEKDRDQIRAIMRVKHKPKKEVQKEIKEELWQK